MRWSYFSLNVDEFIRVSGKNLETFLNSSKVLSEDVVVATSEQLKNICSNSANRDYDQLSAHHFVSQFNNDIRKQLSDSSNLLPWVNSENGEICLFQFGHSPGYPEKEVRLSRTFEWELFLNGRQRDA